MRNENMQKFQKIFEVSLQNRFEYRLNSFLWMVYSFIPILASMALWSAVYSVQNNNNLSYSKNDMMTYYFIVMIVSNLMKAGYDYYGVANDIKNGGINPYLVRPYDFMKYKFIYSLSENVLFIVIGFVPIVIIGVLFRNMIAINVDILDIVFWIIAIVIGYVINFLCLFIMSICAFFMNSINSLFMTLDILKSIVSGQLFPLMVLPASIYNVLKYSPFQYMLYYPVCILQGNYTNNEMLLFTVIGMMWSIVLFAIARLVWRKGLSSYSAFGG